MPTALSNSSHPHIRPFLRFAFGASIAVTLALIALPWWLGLILPRAARTVGATFSRYERLSYTRFALHEVNFRLNGTTVSTARLEADSPLVWLFRRTFGQPGPVTTATWRVEIALSSAPSATPSGWLPLRAQLRSAFVSLRPWLPRATLGPGELTAPAFALKLTAATWENSTLTLRAVSTPLAPVAADLTLALFPQNQDLLQLTVALAHPTYPARLAVESRADSLTGQLTFLDQPAHLAATFAPTGWLPATATLRADAWDLPGSRLPLFSDYATLRGNARLDWRDAQLTLDADAAGDPAPQTSAPPLTAQLQARSDGTTLHFTTLQVTAPGLRADLAAPVIIDRAGKLLSGDSRFTLTADLAAWPQLTAQGTVTGEARVTPGPAQLSRVDFQLAAKALSVRAWQLSAFTAAGHLDWPQLTLTTAALESTNGDRLTVTGGYDFSSREVRDAQVSGRVARATLAPLLPAALDFATLALEARATGPLTALNHSGNLTVDALALPPLKPLALTATWQGLDRTLAAFSATATAGVTRLTAAGYSTTDAITLTAFSFGALLLTSPATLRWAPEPQLAAFNLASADSDSGLSAAFRLGPAGTIDVAVKNFASSALADLITLPAPAWVITALALNGSWDRGPLTFTTTADATLALGENQSARVNLSATGDPTGLQLTALNVLAGTETALRATGQLPFTVTPHASAPPTFSILPDAPLALNAATEPTAAFWTQLHALTGVELVAPQFSAKLTGTWSQPRGTATLRATRLALDPARFDLSLPAVEAFELDLTGDPTGLVLQKFSATLDGQAIRATGRLPVAAGSWNTTLRTTPLALLTDAAELHLEIPDADIAALAHHLPDYLAPQGRLALDLTLKPGGNLTGFLRLTDAASRPFGALGAIQDINADLQLSGRTLTLATLNARTGGQPVTLAGTVTLPRRAPPQLDLTLKGTNLPLVRQLGLLLRGDLDLRLTTPAADATLLAGSIRLHDSLFLADVRDLIPSGERGTTARAPYFAVETAPFNRWRLDVAVDGDRFLRLRTALFNGVASAHFRLTGTLGAPLALGEATVNEGNVLLPFASFAVQQTSIRLTAENPHDPSLWVTGTTRRYGYDLRLELSGALSAPVLTFTSSPALDSKQVLLLVMAGQLPGNPGVITERQRATRLGTYLGKSLLGSLGGDSAAGDRLNFTTGERISRQGRETFGLEYRLDERWSLVGEYDEFDDYNAGVKWRIIAAPVSAAP